jgi:hypothetical protein
MQQEDQLRAEGTVRPGDLLGHPQTRTSFHSGVATKLTTIGQMQDGLLVRILMERVVIPGDAFSTTACEQALTQSLSASRSTERTSRCSRTAGGGRDGGSCGVRRGSLQLVGAHVLGVLLLLTLEHTVGGGHGAHDDERPALAARRVKCSRADRLIGASSGRRRKRAGGDEMDGRCSGTHLSCHNA